MTLSEDLNERLIAAVDLVGRSSARHLEFGYLHDDAPIEEADWWATATYRGERITVEHHVGPIAAVEALAERLLTGSMCAHCQKLVSLSDDGAFAYFTAHLVDGRTWTAEEAAARGQCRWRRVRARWVRGCETAGPNRAARRGHRARRRR